MIEKVVANGETLIRQHHFASQPIKEKNKEVSEQWSQLVECSAERKNKLDISLQKQRVSSQVHSLRLTCYILLLGNVVHVKSAKGCDFWKT